MKLAPEVGGVGLIASSPHEANPLCGKCTCACAHVTYVTSVQVRTVMYNNNLISSNGGSDSESVSFCYALPPPQADMAFFIGESKTTF